MSPLFVNAVASIRMGVEDYSQQDAARALSAVRNFYAGLLLLAKEVLSRAAPNADVDLMIAARIKPVPDGQGGLTVEPDGPQTIDFGTIGKRFADFKLKLDQKALADLNRIRNDIEHRYTTHGEEAVRSAIARAFPVAADLFRQLGKDPVQHLGDVWLKMLETKEFYDRQVAECRASRAGIVWFSGTVSRTDLECPKCSSILIEQKDPENNDQESAEFRCRACGQDQSMEQVVSHTVAEALAGEAYIRVKDANEDGPVYECPNCFNNAYVDFEGSCAVCGHEVHAKPCWRCHSPLIMDELLHGDGGLCGYCAHVVAKVMEE